jgi:hypothetical protein
MKTVCALAAPANPSTAATHTTPTTNRDNVPRATIVISLGNDLTACAGILPAVAAFGKEMASRGRWARGIYAHSNRAHTPRPLPDRRPAAAKTSQT